MIAKLLTQCAFLLLFTSCALAKDPVIAFCGSSKNDLYILLKQEGYKIKHYESLQSAIQSSSPGTPVFVVSDSYPETDSKQRISEAMLKAINRKELNVYIEYPAFFPGLAMEQEPLETRLERGVVTSNAFGESLPPMSLLGIHNCHILPVREENPLIVLAKVVGFDKAEYGLDSTKTYPLLFKRGRVFLSMTKLSNFATARYGPIASIKRVWTWLLAEMTRQPGLKIDNWLTYVRPMYQKDEPLPANARLQSVRRGVEWFDNANLFVHPEWKDLWLKYQGDGLMPVGPPLPSELPNGDGTLGIIEGHTSSINYDGSQLYRYWMRADVQGEVSMALAAAGNAFNDKGYREKAANLINYLFETSNMRAGAKDDRSSPAYGLIGWSVTQPGSFYGDDNARAILGIIGASAYLESTEWDTEIVEAIMANFRTTGKQGFRSSRLEEGDIVANGLKFYEERDLFYPSPHFESWMWACYLWLYNKTGYEPLLEKTKTAIKLTMEAYPKKWLWGSSLQTQRARMVLPLAWLVRIEDTEEHRRWLDIVAADLLKAQVESGGIREEIGDGPGLFRELKSNSDYGVDESSLIFENGDPVAEMLYTCNFAIFSLNEAAHATGNPSYRKAAEKLSDFLVRIQVESEKHKDIDGAWFRAFEYDRWDYWASNADKGWGAWCTLSGWSQSWIVTSLLQIEQDESYWDLTAGTRPDGSLKKTVDFMSKKR
ncbi:hypothetical protein EDD80_10721 [Anseongella ginsenosidimutans]|uniref:Uncharacterized protein n=1 Tax=Anseongella ginsenosidimutans TaxID=496056 RepID=A0A4R3KPA0_9SPHI|nr:hypothetical protein [Anseongella ginsenosidimutans]TCS86488.1 hypothetical protein EDD80_10721 [Anseongella ginsenosidimutans]